MLEDVLVISPFAGYANAGHAGAKTHYNYIKKLEDKYNLTILTHIRPSEESVKKYIEVYNYAIKFEKQK